MTTGEQGIELIKVFEGLHDGDLSKIGLQPKLCPADIWTVGWGHAIVDPVTKLFIRADTPNGYKRACELYPNLTLEQAEELLVQDLKKYENKVNLRVKIPLEQYQFDALVSHTFNTGGSTTLFALVNADYLSANSIKSWWTQHYITANGKTLKGLMKRRLAEYELFNTGKLTLK